MRRYRSGEAGYYLKLYSLLIPMLYCDAITDAMIKGLGQQKISVRYNIFTNILDLAFLYLLLPKYGMAGYYFSFLVTHLVNFCLSLRRLLKITGVHIPFYIPALSISAAAGAVWTVSHLSVPSLQALLYPVVLGCLLYLLQILRREDFIWLKGLIAGK